MGFFLDKIYSSKARTTAVSCTACDNYCSGGCKGCDNGCRGCRGGCKC